MSRAFQILSVLLFGMLSSSVWAHPMDEWFVDLAWADGQGLSGQLRVPADQWEALRKTPLVIEADGAPLQLQWGSTGSDESTRVIVEVSGPSTASASNLKIEVPQGLLDDNQSLVGFLRFDGADAVTVLVPAHETKEFSRPTAHDEESPETIGAFFQFGLKHIIEGYDHLLFLFCLLIPGGTFRHFLVVVTAFTVGHSLTLGASVLGYISLPSALTESIIALSIVVAALLNVRLFMTRSEEGDEAPILSRGIMAGGFGLIHGLGFAGLLMEVGIKGTNVMAPLLGFNLGVEVGQLAIVAVFFPFLVALYRWKHRNPVLITSSLLAAALGGYWFLERAGLL